MKMKAIKGSYATDPLDTDRDQMEFDFDPVKTTKSPSSSSASGISIKVPSPTVLNLEIVQVPNGYIVRDAYQPTIGGMLPTVQGVFNDFYDMCNWLREYYNEPKPNSD